MTAVVIDTNILVVANNRNEQADLACITECLKALIKVRERDIVLHDSESLILYEYLRHSSLSGQPGAGDQFVKWLWENQGNPQHCRQVSVTRRSADLGDFAEFPDDPDLATFDRSDRKFVAVALASGEEPPIFNAVDSDWAEHYLALGRNGVVVTFLCPQHVNGKA